MNFAYSKNKFSQTGYFRSKTEKSHFCVRPWLLLTILNFSARRPTDTRVFQPYPGWAFSGLLTDGRGGKKAPLPKICHTYPTTIKLGTVIPYPRKIKKIYESRDTPLDQHFFHRKSANFAISKNTDIDCILIHNFYLF